jgi:hypothetical protein
MNLKLASSCFVAAALLLPVAGYAAGSDRSSATSYAKDSVITSKIKSELAAACAVSVTSQPSSVHR